MISIIDFGSSKTPLIASSLSSLNYPSEVTVWTDTPQLDKAKGIILTGSPTLFTEAGTAAYTGRFEFLSRLRIPVLGICFGHQLLGILHGSTVFKGEAIRTAVEISLLESDPLFKGLYPKTVFTEDHTEGIDLPKHFKLLARSADYEVEGMRHLVKPFYGVQFHPEVSGEAGKILLNNFCSICYG